MVNANFQNKSLFNKSDKTITIRHQPLTYVTSIRVNKHILNLIKQYDKQGIITSCQAITSLYTALEQAIKVKLPIYTEINPKLGLNFTLNCSTLNVQVQQQVIRSRRYGHVPFEGREQNRYLNFDIDIDETAILSRRDVQDY